MKKEFSAKKLIIIAAAACALLAASACAAVSDSGGGENAPSSEREEPAEQTQSVSPVIGTAENENGEAVFSLSMDDFTGRFNAAYVGTEETAFLPAAEEWTLFNYEKSPYSDFETRLYNFKQGENNFIEPGISAYVPGCGEKLQALTLDFDDHGYTDWAFELYKGYCAAALGVFFPELTEERIGGLFEELYALSFEPSSYVEDDYDAKPKALYYLGGVGAYTYYCAGMVHICLVPVTEELLESAEVAVELQP